MQPSGMAGANKTAVDELMAAIGNPDTDSKSEAWQRFETAISEGDSARIRTAAAEVLGHLDASRRAVAPYVQLSENLREWVLLVDGIRLGVIGMRDGAIGGSTGAVQAGRDRMQAALLDHFWQSIYGPTADRFWHQWRSPDIRVAIASHTRLNQPVAYAFDQQADTAWMAGLEAPLPQWIEVDFGRDVSVSGVRLQVFQEAAGASSHVVTVQSCDGKALELTTFAAPMADRQWLEYAVTSPLAGIRLVRITTTASPGMVGWREIEIAAE
jgi:hypothetical protein